MCKVSCSAANLRDSGSASGRCRRHGRRALLALVAFSSFPHDLNSAAAVLSHPRLSAPESIIERVASCGEPEIALVAEAGGLTQISIASSCRAGELVSLSYAEATLVARLDGEGRSVTMLDCFAGDAVPITIAFEDGTSIARKPVTDDLARYSKVAIVWSSSVDLDLHAFEYAAAANDTGHIWSGQRRSLADAEATIQGDKRGHGFLSTASTGDAIGMNVEVYTFAHTPRQKPAGVKMAVEFVTRGSRAEGETCGAGRYADIPFKAYTLERGRDAKRLDLAFASVPCGTELSDAVRVNSRLIPELMIRE
jgi:hypothetical protein